MIDRIGSGTVVRFSGPFEQAVESLLTAEALGLQVTDSSTHGGLGRFTAVTTEEMTWSQFRRMAHLISVAKEREDAANDGLPHRGSGGCRERPHGSPRRASTCAGVVELLQPTLRAALEVERSSVAPPACAEEPTASLALSRRSQATPMTRGMMVAFKRGAPGLFSGGIAHAVAGPQDNCAVCGAQVDLVVDMRWELSQAEPCRACAEQVPRLYHPWPDASRRPGADGPVR